MSTKKTVEIEEIKQKEYKLKKYVEYANYINKNEFDSNKLKDAIKDLIKSNHNNIVDIYKFYKKIPKFSVYIKSLQLGKTEEEKLYNHVFETTPSNFICCQCVKRTRKFKNIKIGYSDFCSKTCYDTYQIIKCNKIEAHNLKDFKKYCEIVWSITDVQKLNNIELRGNDWDAFHLDHRFSIYEGFKNKIPAYIIGNICNLEMIPKYENLKKSTKCSISKEELFKSFFN